MIPISRDMISMFKDVNVHFENFVDRDDTLNQIQAPSVYFY